MPELARYTVSFGDPGADDPALVGGKGANLAKLVAAGFTVPSGFTVTTDAHRDAHQNTGLDKDIAAICGQLDYGDADDLERRTSDIRLRVTSAELPAEVTSAIRSAYSALGMEAYVAVRSSGTAEDLADASFAGLHDTFLDVRGIDAVLTAVQKCWASMWTARATAYRQEKGFDHADASLAVVVQTMVGADVSGVLFTANPLTTATDELVINSSYGLGESVVGGVITPDEFVVHADNRRILERTPGSKATEVVRDPDAAHGTITRPVEPERAAAFSLSDRHVAELSGLGLRVQDYYGGFPQDIEWALQDGIFYLLQSRPVTGVPFSWDADLEETNVNNQVDDDWVWTRAFADAVHTGGICPMTYSARFTYGMTECWNAIANNAGIAELAGKRMFKYHKGELYYNCAWERVWIERMVFPFARSGQALEMVPESWRDEIAASPFSTLAYLKGLLRTQLLDPRVVGFDKMMADWRANRVAEVMGLTPEELQNLSDRELRRYIKHQLEVELDYGAPVVGALVAHMGALMSILAMLLAKWYDGDPLTTFTRLISGSRQRTDTQIENHALWELAQVIRSSPELRALFDEHEGAAFFAACEDSPAGREFLDRYKPFAAAYGHRGHADRDLLYLRREEDPGRDYPAFRALLSVDNPVSPEQQEQEVNDRRESTFEEVLECVRRKPLGGLRAEALKLLYARIHDYIIMRDNERQFPNDAVIMSYKRGFNEIGRRLHDRGLVDLPDDVYFLGEPEAYALLEGNTTRLPLLRAKIQARRRDVERRRSGTVEMPKYLQRNRAVSLDAVGPELSSADGVFPGMPTSPGMMTGRARVIRTLAEIGNVEDGDILVTNSTDPGWTPVFLVIKGVIVETGGILSHASCLAREYGFPAVQLERAMALIPDGAEITIDGNTGRVAIVDS